MFDLVSNISPDEKQEKKHKFSTNNLNKYTNCIKNQNYLINKNYKLADSTKNLHNSLMLFSLKKPEINKSIAQKDSLIKSA